MNEMNVLTLNGEQYEIADKKARQNMASAVAVTMTGTAVSTDMVSPIEHEVECRIAQANLLPFPYLSKYETVSGITATLLPDQSVKFDGTATVDYRFIFKDIQPQISLNINRLAYVSGCPKGGSEKTYYILAYLAKYGYTNIFKKDTGHGVVFSGCDTLNYIKFVINKGTAVSNLVVKPMVSYYKIPYVPYKNVPDLSAVRVTRDRPDGTDAQTYTVNSDGSVNGPVKSLSPDMRIKVSDAGAVAVSTYNADTKKYIDSKFTEMQALVLDLKGGM